MVSFYRIPLTIFLVLASVFTLGCKEKKTLRGEAFIVTEGRDNVELGLMEVHVYNPDSINNHLSKRHEASIDSFRNVAPKVDPILDSLSYASRRFDRITSMELDGMGLDELSDYKEKLDESTRLLSKMNKISEKTIDSILSVRSQNFYIKNAPKPLYSTKTDSDGKFSFETWISKEYVILAEAQRKVADSTEHYFWMERVKLSEIEDNKIMLSNDNLNGISDKSGALTDKEVNFVKDSVLKLVKNDKDIDYEKILYGLSFPSDSINAVPDSVRKDAPETYI